jgi:hypothetical protein
MNPHTASPTVVGQIEDGQISGDCIHAGPSDIRRCDPFIGKNVGLWEEKESGSASRKLSLAIIALNLTLAGSLYIYVD